MPQQKKNPYAAPAQPTRERALYLTAAHGYADAFRCTFVDPITARRRFRRAAEWDEGRALSDLLLHPDDYGPRCVRRFASAVRDPRVHLLDDAGAAPPRVPDAHRGAPVCGGGAAGAHQAH